VVTRWVLYDDPGAARLRPFTWLRPAADLLLGCFTTFRRWRRLVGTEHVVVACRRELASLVPGRADWQSVAIETETPGIKRESAEAGSTGPDVWVSDLVLPEPMLIAALDDLAPDSAAVCAGHLIAFRCGPEVKRLLAGAVPTDSLALALGHIQGSMPTIEIAAERLSGLADLIRLQGALIRKDLCQWIEQGPPSMQHGDGVTYVADQVWVGENCRIDSGAVLDAREGPIVLEAGCQVFPHAWVQGPLYAGPGTRLVGGRIGGGTSLGPRCRVHGEVEASVFLGFDNKAHDGYVGHSILGEWVNLGALTTTSDLKNNYSFVTLTPNGSPERTALRKVGVFLGDHAKTRIGSLLTCGTIVGVGANLIGSPAVSAKWVPDFTWGDEGLEYEINKFLETAEIVYGRREVTWTPALAALLRGVHAATRQTRRTPPAGFDQEG
jgi:UDP-N-acetylglucosamine diphosphorylase / glucose-1-phosphate thymidylyltransferase / UDP-N-acetylgalactosamine diphosphorylase / glucosamine-1-phosphate N-acetyltransferase / galactosamine-1-phosphate N-acetyltransferase